MDKNPEISILMQLLKGEAFQQGVLNPVHAAGLIKLAGRHKTLYQLLVFARQHAELFSAEQLVALENRCRQSALQSLVQLNELKRIAGRLNDCGIGYVCIKGPQLARRIYGREALKESVDIDIMLVNATDLQKVHDLLATLGYNRSNLNRYAGRLSRKRFLIAKREVQYFNRDNRCAIDLHIRPGANTYLTEKNFRDLLTNLVNENLEGTPVKVLPDEAYFVYLCYHGSLHQFSRLAWLLDIRAFLQVTGDGLNWHTVYSEALKLKVERNVLLALWLMKEYFGDVHAGRYMQVVAERHKTKANSMSPRMRYLVKVCKNMLYREAGYGISIRGRIVKVVYIMLLIKGWAGRVDWVYGIVMRKLFANR